MYMLKPDLLQLKTNDIQTSQWARAPGPGPKKKTWTRAPAFVLGPVPRLFFWARARGPGPLTILIMNRIELKEIWLEHIHIGPLKGICSEGNNILIN